MIIGDWNLTVLREQSFQTIPGDDTSVIQKMIYYKLTYVPKDYHLYQSVHLIKPHTDEQLLERLTELVNMLKRKVIDFLGVTIEEQIANYREGD